MINVATPNKNRWEAVYPTGREHTIKTEFHWYSKQRPLLQCPVNKEHFRSIELKRIYFNKYLHSSTGSKNKYPGQTLLMCS